MEALMDFGQFWYLYPRKVARKAALKAWSRLTDSEQAKALEALPAHILLWDDQAFTPHASTWLHGERWTDVLESRQPSLVSAWWTTHEGVEKRGRDLGLAPKVGESHGGYKNRVIEADRAKRAA